MKYIDHLQIFYIDSTFDNFQCSKEQGISAMEKILESQDDHIVISNSVVKKSEVRSAKMVKIPILIDE